MDMISSSSVNTSSPVDELSIIDRMAGVDWSFSSRLPTPEIESIHPYPAKFIGEIPRTLIEHLPLPASTAVFDPFCGSGTTLVEAQRAGYNAIGIDLNPIACLLSRVKTSVLRPGLGDAAISVIDAAQRDCSPVTSGIPNVGHWFKPEVQRAVGALTRVIASVEYNPWSDQLRLALSSILVRVSNQESDTRYAAIEKAVSTDDVYSAFDSAAAKLERALGNRNWSLSSAQVIENSTLEVRSSDVNGSVGLVITSPPYPNAYEYWLYHKYRMWWLGFDPLLVKAKEIGARAHFFKKNPHTADLFIDQMRQTFALIDAVLVRQGFVCFVVGRSRIHGKIIDNAAIIDRVAAERSLTTVTRFERVISPHRKSFNLSHANIKTETILIFQKP